MLLLQVKDVFPVSSHFESNVFSKCSVVNSSHSISHPVSLIVSLSVSQSVCQSQSVSLSICHFASLLVYHFVRQSVSQSVSQFIYQLVCESVSLQSLSQSFSPPVGQSVSLSLIESFHSFKFPVNFPDVDVGFAISAASADSDKIFSLMKQIINTIVDRYGVNKVRFSFIVYGSRVTTRFTFDNAPITQEELIKAVNGTEKVTGDPDLEKALEEAEQLFTKTSRPNATRVFVVLTDIVGSGDDNSLIATSARLRKGGVLILSVGFGQQVNAISNQMTKVVIAQSDYISVPDFTTQRPVVIAETIMFKALQGKYNFKCVPLMPRD